MTRTLLVLLGESLTVMHTWTAVHFYLLFNTLTHNYFFLLVCASRARRSQPDVVTGGLKRSHISASVVQQQTNWLKTFREELRHSTTKAGTVDYGRPSTAHAAIYSDHVGGAGSAVGMGGHAEDETKTQATGTRV